MGLVGVVLFSLDALREDPAVFGVLQAVGAAILFYGGLRASRGRPAGGTIAAIGLFIVLLLLRVAGDAVIRGGFTQPLVDAIFVLIFTLPTLVALFLIVTESASPESQP